MNEFINIDISGIKLDVINILKNQYNPNMRIVNGKIDDVIHLQIPKSFEDDSLLMALSDFLEALKNNRTYELMPSWIFDESNAVIISPLKKFYLTTKEVLFLKMLIKDDKITTYDAMSNILWQGRDDVSQNAMRVFAKNIKKKLPPKILKNFQDIGYKLELV